MSPGNELASPDSGSPRQGTSTAMSHAVRDMPLPYGGLARPVPNTESKGEDWLGPYRVVHRALRGRYIVVLVIGLLGAGLGSWAGWRSQKPLYRSEGVIRIAYATPPALKETDVNGPLAMFEALMQSQRLLLTGRRLLDLALQEPAWKATGRGVSAAVVEDFAAGLKAEYLPRTENLRITFTSEDATIAAAAVNAIISAYGKVYDSQELQFQQKRTRVLEQRREELEQQIRSVEASIQEVTGGVPPSNLERLEEVALQKMQRLSANLAGIRMALALSEKQDVGGGATPTVVLTPRQIAMVDPLMRSLLGEQTRLQEKLDQMRMRLGESHQEVLQAKKAFEAAEARVNEYASDYSTYQSKLANSPDAAQLGSVPMGSQSIQSLRSNEAIVSEQLEQAKDEVTAIGRKRQEIQKLTNQVQDLRAALAPVVQRIGDLKMESSLSGRLEVISNGEVPLAPILDRRQKMGVLGALAGALLPIGLSLALMLASRRYRYSDETETDISQSTPLLGIVPRLPEYLSDPEQAAMAAQCMHQARAMLQVSRPHDSRHVYMITSSTSGEGKTSVTVALGLSFAACGSRTLLIDCDMVGQRLTRGFKADNLSGVREAVAAGSIEGCVHKTSTGVYVLSTGKAEAMDACALSSTSIRQLVAEASASFDVVLIDTGPVLGSVEPLLIAPEVDGVIMTISRGQERPLVEKTMRQLRMAGARIAGFIFNRAERRDFHRSAQASSIRSTANPNLPVRKVVPGSSDSSSFGPLVHSVASFLPTSS
ncbi:MAG: P-loop NTPase [Bacillota bacterium]